MRWRIFVFLLLMCVSCNVPDKKDAYENYTPTERKHYSDLTDKSCRLLFYLSSRYEREKGKPLNSLNDLVGDGWLKELPREYITCKEGNNNLTFFRQDRKNIEKNVLRGGWGEERLPSGEWSFFANFAGGWDIGPYSDTDPYLEQWFQDEGKAMFSDILIVK